jgi:hypothetical protein
VGRFTVSGAAPANCPIISGVTRTAEELLRAFQQQERRFVERRFPLQFASEVPALRELYRQAKGLRWNPETDVPWARLDGGRLSTSLRDAARLIWSRRAWGTYPGLGESTALLLRLCLESGTSQMDAKLFLSFRAAEEAKHLEACFILAERLGGYIPDPGDDVIVRASNHAFAQMALDPRVRPEASVAALGCLDDQLDLDLHVSHLHGATDDTVRAVLRLMATDKARHALFAWTWLGTRLAGLDIAGRQAVGEAVREMLEQVILRGYRNTWLLPDSLGRRRFLEAEAATAAAGLGASTREQEERVLRATVGQVRARLQQWDVVVPLATHSELGRV